MTRNLTEDEWMEQFEKGDVPNGAFHHADHVRMAFLYLRKYPPLEALARFSSGLMRLAAAHGKPDLYHETITWAFLLLIRERMARENRPLTWSEFSEANPDLLRWDDHVLKRYYRPETLASGLAKKVFLLPDSL
ncbi:MAG: hypothetical protein WA857_09345 [Candidatus Acidiferrum sp.]